MTNINHTPTPWHYGEEVSRVGHRLVYGPDKYLVASCGTKRADEIDQANAHFIEKAVNSHDDMLVALKACVEELHLWTNGTNHRDLNKAKVGAKYWAASAAKQAIAKAEGR